MTDDILGQWRRYLVDREAAPATIEKYVREARHLLTYLCECGFDLEREAVLSYKRDRLGRRAVTGANSAIATLNGLFGMMGRPDLLLRRLRVQQMPRVADRELTREEYKQLTRRCPAQHEGARLIAQTLCATGIRVSELRYVTMEAAMARYAVVTNKGRTRRVWIPERLCRALIVFAQHHGVRRGPVFVTRTGRPVDRTRVWRLLKDLAHATGVEARKVFPHSLRHLFATTFQRRHHDIEALGLILGHARIETTRAYLALDEAERKRQVACLGLV